MMSARRHIGRQSVALTGAEYADGASPLDVNRGCRPALGPGNPVAHHPCPAARQT